MTCLSEGWDIVIHDTPPVPTVSDALLLAMRADAILVVVRAGITRRGALRGCLAALSQTGRPVLGVVLNDFRPGPLARYSGYSYYSYYSSDGAHQNGASSLAAGLGSRRPAE
jgi:Mrp family chromosome partitioning ATPase